MNHIDITREYSQMPDEESREFRKTLTDSEIEMLKEYETAEKRLELLGYFEKNNSVSSLRSLKLDNLILNDEIFLKLQKNKGNTLDLFSVTSIYSEKDSASEDYLINLILENRIDDTVARKITEKITDCFFRLSMVIIVYNQNSLNSPSKTVDEYAKEHEDDFVFRFLRRVNTINLFEPEGGMLKLWLKYEEENFQEIIINIIENFDLNFDSAIELIETARKIRSQLEVKNDLEEFNNLPIEWILAQH